MVDRARTRPRRLLPPEDRCFGGRAGRGARHRPAARPPGVLTPDAAEVRAAVDQLTAALVEALGPRLIGAYLHGSLSTGSWRPGSDVDLLAVVTGPDDEAVVEEVAATIQVPAPMELRVWPSDRPDPDLPVHRTAVAIRGVALHGPPPDQVVEAPPWDEFLGVLMGDVDRALDAGLAGAHPEQAVLTVCRGLATLSSAPGTLFGKEEAGAWALERLPAEHRPLIELALAVRRDPEAAVQWDSDALRRFRTFAVGAAVRRRPGRKVAGLP